MFADPQSVTYATVAKSLVKIDNPPGSGVYGLNDSGVVYNLALSHQLKATGRNRVVSRLTRSAFAADVLVPAQNILASATSSFTLDFPSYGLTAADIQALGVAHVGWLSSANILRLIQGET